MTKMVRSGTILVVEDEAPLRLAVTSFLRKRGFTVIEAADGTVALAMVREFKDAIALVLLDITLPGAPSREAMRRQPDPPGGLRPKGSRPMPGPRVSAAIEPNTAQ